MGQFGSRPAGFEAVRQQLKNLPVPSVPQKRQLINAMMAAPGNGVRVERGQVLTGNMQFGKTTPFKRGK